MAKSLPDPSPEPPRHVSSKRVLWLVSMLVFLVLGGCLGAVVVLTTEHFVSKMRFVSWMAILAGAAASLLLVAIVVGIIRWLWRHRGAHLLTQVREAVGMIFSKPPDRSWSKHLPEVWSEKGKLLWNFLVITLALWAGIALLTPLVSSLFSFASYLSAQAQVQVIGTQNRIVAIEQEFQQANTFAEQRFEQLSRVLLDVGGSPGEQVFALREVPDAMRMAVPRAEPDESAPGGVRIVYALPNLNRLRDVIRQFISIDRVSATLRTSGIPHQAGQILSEDALLALDPLAPVSTELLHLLHRLGPANENRPEHRLWTWNPPSTRSHISVVPQVDDIQQIPMPREALNDRMEGTIALGHLNERDLERLVAPGLLMGMPWKLFAQRRLSLADAQLQGANLVWAHLQEADLSRAQLQSADLSGAQLKDAALIGTQLQGCSLFWAQLQAADLFGAQLQAAELIGAQFQDAEIIEAQFQGADLFGAQFRGANLTGSQFAGANLFMAQFQGANLSGAQFLRANMWSQNFLRENAFTDWLDSPSTVEFGGVEMFFPRTLQRISEVGASFASDDDHPVCVTLPGTVLTHVSGLCPVEALVLRIDNATNFRKALDDARTKLDEFEVAWWDAMPDFALSSYPWPIALEKYLRNVPGVTIEGKRWVGSLVTPPGTLSRVYRIRFSSLLESAWMTTEVRNTLLKSLDAEPYISYAKQSSEASRLIAELRDDLTDHVNLPRDFPSTENWQWSLWRRENWRLSEAHEEATREITRESDDGGLRERNE